MRFEPRAQSPFSPVLLDANTEVLAVTEEQKLYIKEVLDIASSDVQFAKKAYDAIALILTGGRAVVGVVSSLNPETAAIGDPSFVLHVMGENFDKDSQIVFAGQLEPTTFVSPTEVTTGVDMSVWLGADVLPVGVVGKNGVLSNVVDFTFTAGGAAVLDSDANRKSESYQPGTVGSFVPASPSPESNQFPLKF